VFTGRPAAGVPGACCKACRREVSASSGVVSPLRRRARSFLVTCAPVSWQHAPVSWRYAPVSRWCASFPVVRQSPGDVLAPGVAATAPPRRRGQRVQETTDARGSRDRRTHRPRRRSRRSGAASSADSAPEEAGAAAMPSSRPHAAVRSRTSRRASWRRVKRPQSAKTASAADEISSGGPASGGGFPQPARVRSARCVLERRVPVAPSWKRRVPVAPRWSGGSR
jgi:hypothetical protein